MALNKTEWTWLEQKSATKFWLTELCKLCEIYRTYDVYEKTRFSN